VFTVMRLEASLWYRLLLG